MLGLCNFLYPFILTLPVSLGVEGSLSEEDWVLFWGNTELIVEGVMPDLLHIIPVGDNAVLNGVFQGKDTSLALGLISYIAVFLTHTHHDTLREERRREKNCWENSSKRSEEKDTKKILRCKMFLICVVNDSVIFLTGF